MDTHTPTPWAIGNDGTLRNLEGHVFSGARLVANCHGHQDGKELTRKENEANARFIVIACNAHADLLAALEDVTELIQKWRETGGVDSFAALTDAHDTARAAIAKANGETD